MSILKSEDRVEHVQPLEGDLTTGILTAVALNAAAASRTIQLDMAGWNYAVFDIVFARDTATDIQIAVTGRHPHASTNDFRVPVIDVSSSAITYGYPNHKYTTSTTGKYKMVVPVPAGSKYVSFVFSGTSAGGNDTIQVYVTKVASE